jgi:hypothetical protein
MPIPGNQHSAKHEPRLRRPWCKEFRYGSEKWPDNAAGDSRVVERFKTSLVHGEPGVLIAVNIPPTQLVLACLGSLTGQLSPVRPA